MLQINQLKKCIKCDEIKPFYCFPNNKSKKEGKESRCKVCAYKKQKEWRENNKEKISDRDKKYRELNKEKLKVYFKNFRNKNRDKISDKRKINYKKNKEKIDERNMEWKQKNRDKYIASKKKHYNENKEIILEQQKKYLQTPMGKASNNNRTHKRRVLIRESDVTSKQLLELQQNSTHCYWCNKKLTKKTKIHIDHYIPLSKGGDHTLSNLVLACSECNLTKSAKDPHEFAISIGRLL